MPAMVRTARALVLFATLSAPAGFAQEPAADPPPAEKTPPPPGAGTVRVLEPKRGPTVEPVRPEGVGPMPAPTSVSQDDGPITEHRKNLTWIGFHQAKGYSRIFFKTTERVAFDVVPGTGVVNVKLKNTRARLRNNLRFLDTSYFPTAVWRVVPHQKRRIRDLSVEIQMREAVPYRVRRQGDVIQFDFDLPAKK
jgi:colicin import membrane protein